MFSRTVARFKNRKAWRFSWFSSRRVDPRVTLAARAVVEGLENRTLLSGLPPDINLSPDCAYTLTGDATAETLTVTEGAIAFNQNDGANGSLPNLSVILTGNAVAAINSPLTLVGLTVSGTANVTVTSSGGGTTGNLVDIGTGGFSMPLDPTTNLPTATLDMMDNDIILRGAGDAELPALRTLLKDGKSGAGLKSSDAANSPSTEKTALGYGDGFTSFDGLSTIDGQAVSVTDVLVKYTLAGDANLSGKVDNADQTAVSNHWLQSGTGIYWQQGDFSLDSKVSNVDEAILSNNWQNSILGPNFNRTLQPVGLPITTVEGQSFTGTLATFTDTLNTSSTPTNAGDYTATVSWGNNTFVPATVTADTDPNDPQGYIISATSPAPLSNADALFITMVQYAAGTGLQGRPASLGEPIVTITPAVSDLTATPVSVSQINLNWTLNATNATSIEVDRATDGGAFVMLTNSLSGSATTFADTTVGEGHSYSYQIRAIQPIGPSAYAGPAVATTLAVQRLYVIAASTTEIDLSWLNLSADPSATVDVQRAPFGSSTFTTIASGLAANSTSFNDITGLTEGTHYVYQVVLHDSFGNTFTAPADTWTLPNAPSGLAAVADGSGNVILSWTNNSPTSPPFYIERSTDGTNFSIVDETGAGATTYVDDSPGEGTFYYRVDSVNGDGTASNPSGIASATNPLTPPSDLSAQAISASEIDLTWTNNSAVADGITILRSTDGITYSKLTTLSDPTTQFYADMALSAGTHYYYEVEATQSTAASAPSVEADDTTVPPAPTPTVTLVTGSTIDLVWPATPGATSYDIQRQASGGPWLDLGPIVSSPNPSFQNTGLWDGLTYTYQISASNAAGTSAFGSVSATTAKFAPVGPWVQAVELTENSAEVMWTNNAYNEDNFAIERSTNGQPWTTIATVGTGTRTYLDTSLSPNNQYDYLVVAHNSAGDANMSGWGIFTSTDSSGTDVVSVYTAGGPSGNTLVAAEASPDGQPDDGFFEFTRVGDVSQALTVGYTVDTSAADAATAGYEYQALGSSVAFAAGQRVVVVPVTPNEINHVEGNTTVTVNLAAGDGYTASAYGGAASVNIVNTDDARIQMTSPFGFEAGQDTLEPLTYINHYGRPKVGTISASSSNSNVVAVQTSTITTGSDGSGAVQVLGVNPGTTALTCADAAGNAANPQQQVGIPQLSVTGENFTFNHSELIKKDAVKKNDPGATTYTGSQWNDQFNTNGIWKQTVVNAARKTSGSPDDLGAPVAYQVGATMEMSVLFNVKLGDLTDVPAGTWFIYGTADGPNNPAPFFEGSGTATKGPRGVFQIRATLTANEALPATIANADMKINWFIGFTPAVGTWVANANGPTSGNHLYVTRGLSKGANESAYDIGCRAAKGLSDESPVLDAIWAPFSGDSVLEADGQPMKYNGGDDKNGTGALLLNHEGQCYDWASLLVDVLAVQGITASQVLIYPPKNFLLFEVKPMAYQGSGGVTYKRNKFKFHYVVQVKDYPTRIYDPSFGGDYISATTFRGAEVKYEIAKVRGSYRNANDEIIVPIDQNEKVPQLRWP